MLVDCHDRVIARPSATSQTASRRSSAVAVRASGVPPTRELDDDSAAVSRMIGEGCPNCDDSQSPAQGVRSLVVRDDF